VNNLSPGQQLWIAGMFKRRSLFALPLALPAVAASAVAAPKTAETSALYAALEPFRETWTPPRVVSAPTRKMVRAVHIPTVVDRVFDRLEREKPTVDQLARMLGIVAAEPTTEFADEDVAATLGIGPTKAELADAFLAERPFLQAVLDEPTEH